MHDVEVDSLREGEGAVGGEGLAPEGLGHEDIAGDVEVGVALAQL